ncbi:hypothetical protein QT990_24715, partial [Microcoleus sp. T3_B1]|uniref:hypothetical protein n=1 Tax=Microcoleus sp. T3_B1 TaxID=3055425 RepID=UPI002FD5F1A4
EQASCLCPEAHKKPPTKKLTLCGTGILPVPRSPQETTHKKTHSLWNRPESLFPEAHQKPPTKKLTLCGTGILPVCEPHPQKNSLFVEQASCLFQKETYISFHRVHLPS